MSEFRNTFFNFLMERMRKLYRKVLHVQESIEVTCIICSSRMEFELVHL